MQTKICTSLIVMTFLLIQAAIAGNITINNNLEAARPTQNGCNGNINHAYDPRVPPAGSYIIKNSDGSSQQIYTTGENKPYFLNNNCNNNAIAPIQPYVAIPPYHHPKFGR